MAEASDLAVIKEIGALSSDGLFIYHTGSASFTYISPALYSLFAITSARTDLHCFKQAVIPEDLDYLTSVFTRLMADNVVENIEFRASVGEAIKTFCCNAYKTGDCILGIVRDLTQVREHEGYVTSYGAKKDAILEMISHNLSGPLNISHQILTSLEKVTRGYENQDVNKHLELIRESMNHCIDVINDFLIEEHLTSENVFTRKTRFDVVEKVENTLERLRKSFPEKEFHFSTIVNPLFLNSDEVKFFQVFHNLILNSVKFTPERGRVDVLIDCNSHNFSLTVRDNGIGIPDALKVFIFQKYSPASRPGLKNERSIGMGLYITKKLTELMGGTISFNSQEKVGSEFTITLPLE